MSSIFGGGTSKASKQSVENTQQDNQQRQDFFERMAGQARGDVMGLFPQAQQHTSQGFGNALQMMGGAISPQLQNINQGTMGASQQLAGGMDAQMAAILGQQMPQNFNQPIQEMPQDMSWVQDIMQKSIASQNLDPAGAFPVEQPGQPPVPPQAPPQVPQTPQQPQMPQTPKMPTGLPDIPGNQDQLRMERDLLRISRGNDPRNYTMDQIEAFQGGQPQMQQPAAPMPVMQEPQMPQFKQEPQMPPQMPQMPPQMPQMPPQMPQMPPQMPQMPQTSLASIGKFAPSGDSALSLPQMPFVMPSPPKKKAEPRKKAEPKRKAETRKRPTKKKRKAAPKKKRATNRRVYRTRSGGILS
jgi:hypothetical protein